MRCCVQRLKAPDCNRRRARARCAWRAARPGGAQAGVHGCVALPASQPSPLPSHWQRQKPELGLATAGGRPARQSGATGAVCTPARMRRPGVGQARSRGIRAEEGVLCTAQERICVVCLDLNIYERPCARAQRPRRASSLGPWAADGAGAVLPAALLGLLKSQWQCQGR